MGTSEAALHNGGQHGRHGAPQIDFQGLAESLLERAETLVPQWLPWGYKNGHYWYVGDFDGETGKSANVNLKTGAWGDNGRPGDAGRDLLSLFRRVFGHATMLDAARDLMGVERWQTALRAPPPPPKPAKLPKWQSAGLPPADAPDYRTQWGHYARGVPNAHWEYRDRDGVLLGVVCRFDTSDGGKDVQPLSWCSRVDTGELAWRYKAFEEPRPLYGLWRLGPSGTPPPPRVIIVEGEKKADRLHEALQASAQPVPVLAWPGGCNVVHLADWAALQGVAEVLCWPDADAQLDRKTQQLLPADKQPGMAAMLKVRAALQALGCQVQVVDVGPPGSRPEGWDAADAIAEGWTADDLLAFMRCVRTFEPEAEAEVPWTAEEESAITVLAVSAAPSDGGSTPSPAAQAGEGDPRWRDAFIMARGSRQACVANVSLVLHEHPQWQGVLGFDSFAQRVVKRRPAPYDPDDLVCPAEWEDVDDTRAAVWISRREGFVPTAGQVAEAATECARASTFHPVMDWLRGLSHDGTARIDTWLIDYLGVKDTPYARRVSRYFLVGMCRRVIEPGCKFDTCLVLEGNQGRGKSTALRILAGEWFSDTELDLAHKDSMSYIRGKWLHEFAELGSLARSEELRQKSFLSRQVDEFRPTYGRREIRCPRQVAFAGSTNQWQWNKDPTGGRRFWPAEVGVIDLAGLAAVRDQLFAEAFCLAQQRERYWPDAQEQEELFDPEQFAREAPDAFQEILAAWLSSPEVYAKPHFTLADACMSGLKLDAKAMTKDVQTRVGTALHKLGCEKKEQRTKLPRFVYQRPARKDASSQPECAAEDVEVPF